jgi:glycosyltransferase involved in cell wall biosynthesis
MNATGPGPREKCSATVLTLNEEANLRACLESLAWVDEIVVVDSGSTDATLAIAREFTDRVFVQPWAGFTRQKNFASDQCSHRWVLNLDADERVTDALRDRIVALLAAPQQNGYSFPRKNFFLGRWMRHGGWYPDAVLRLFRRDLGRFGGIDPHPSVLLPAGRAAYVPEPMLHYTYTSLGHYVSKQYGYANAAAQVMATDGKTRGSTLLRLIVKPPWRFLENYFWKLGLLDGVHGFLAAVGSAYIAFLREARIWELKREAKSRDSA